MMTKLLALLIISPFVLVAGANGEVGPNREVFEAGGNAVDVPAAKRVGAGTIKKEAGPNRVSCPKKARDIKPGANINKIVARAGQGKTICFKRGTHRITGAVRPLANQTWVFDRGASLSGAKVVRKWTKSGSYWVADGQTQDIAEPPWVRDEKCPTKKEICILEDFFINGKPLKNVATRGELGPGEVYLDKGANRAYLVDDPTNKKVEATVAEFGITVSAKNVTIRGAHVTKVANTGIHVLKANGFSLIDSTISYAHLQGLGIFQSRNAVVRRSRVHHAGIMGVSSSRIVGFKLDHNEFDHNNYLRAGPIAGGWHEGSVKVLLTRDLVFRNNWSHHNFGDGFWCDTDCYNALIENNVLSNNTRHGIQYEASFDAVFRHNTISNNGTNWDAQGVGIWNSTSKNVQYIENRIINNEIRSIAIVWHNRGTHPEWGQRQSSNLLFRNNTIRLANNFQSWVGVYWDADPRVYASNNRFENNTYIVPKNGGERDGKWWFWQETDLNWVQWKAKGFDGSGKLIQKG